VKRPDVVFTAAGALIVLVVVWLLFLALQDRSGTVPADEAEEAPVAPAAVPAEETQTDPATPRIKTRLFYVAEGGRQLVPVEREVEFGKDTAQQARRIIEAQLAPAPEPLVSAIPEGTTLRELFLTPRGQAFVDFSPEIATGHSGGSLDEILTVYTIVNALTQNLPAITEVQILVDGREVDTLAGHVDLRQPLDGDTTWVQATTDD
jgi:germination protein M